MVLACNRMQYLVTFAKPNELILEMCSALLQKVWIYSLIAIVTM